MRAVAVLACLGLLSACNSAPQSAPAAAAPVDVAQRVASRHLRRQLDAPPATLDPALSTDVATQRLLDDLFEGLTRPQADGAVVPAVALSWEHSEDGLSWTFHLDPAARWSNGDPLVAGDFVYAWRHVVDPATASQSAQQFAPIVNALQVTAGKLAPEQLGVRAIDSHTLQVRLVGPTPYLLYLLTNSYFFPLHQATLEKYGASWTRPGNLVSNGAFVLEEQRINGAIQLRRNAHYREAQAVQLERVTYFPVIDRSAATSRYLAGDVDVTDIFGLEDVDWLREQLGSQVKLEPYFGTALLGYHVGRAPFDSRALRLALSMSVDREVITGKLMHGLYLPAYNLVPPLGGYPQVLPDWAKLSQAERHALARQWYAQAGYSQRHPLKVELSLPTGGTDTRRMAEAIAAMWRTNLGAEVTLGTQEWRVHQQNRRLSLYALFWDAWIADYPDPLTFLQMFQRGSGQNNGKYEQPRYEQLLDAATRAGNEAQRLRDYAQAEQQLNDDAPFLPIYFYQSRHLVRPYVKGWVGNVMDRNLSRDLHLDAGQGP
jgi:oligopeptide transport system substrate-binding protein